MFEYGSFQVYWDGDSAVRVRDREFTLAVDPGKDSPVFEAGIVLITGESSFDYESLKKVCGRGTCVVLPSSLRDKTVPCNDVEYVEAGETLDIFSVEIEALEGSELAYRFDMQGTSFYVSGGTGFRKELIDLENHIDVAFLKASEESDEGKAVRSAVRIKPSVVVPYMYSEGNSVVDNLRADLEDRNISCHVMEK